MPRGMRQAGIKITIDGEKELTAQIKRIQQEYKTLTKEIDLVQAQFAGQRNTLQALDAEYKATQSAMSKLVELQGKLRNGSAIMADKIDKETKNRNALKQQLDKEKTVLDELAKTMDKSTVEYQEQEEKVNKLNIEYTKAAATVEDYTRKQDRIREALVNTELAEGDLNTHLLKTKEYLDDASRSADGTTNKIDKFGNEVGETVEGIRSINDAVSLLAGFEGWEKVISFLGDIKNKAMECVQAFADFEKGVVNVTKTVEGLSNAEVADFINDLTKTIPLTAEQLSNIAMQAGQYGISKDNLKTFTEVMSKLQTATNIGEDLSSVAQVASILKLPTEEYERLASTVVELGNNTRTTEKDIFNMARMIAQQGKYLGLSNSEILGVADSLAALGGQAEGAGNAMNRFMEDLHKAVLEGGDELDAFARTAGMSSAEFKQLFQTDAMSAITLVLKGIDQVSDSGGNIYELFKQIGATNIRESNNLKNLSALWEEFAGTIDMANTAWEENIALEEEFGKYADTVSSQMALVENAKDRLKANIGESLTYASDEWVQKEIKIIDFIADHAKNKVDELADYSQTWANGSVFRPTNAAQGIASRANGALWSGGYSQNSAEEDAAAQHWQKMGKIYSDGAESLVSQYENAYRAIHEQTEAIREMYESTFDPMQKFSEKGQLTAKEFAKNLQSNAEKMQKYSDNLIKVLEDPRISDAVKEYVKGLDPSEAYKLVEDFANDKDGKLIKGANEGMAKFNQAISDSSVATGEATGEVTDQVVKSLEDADLAKVARDTGIDAMDGLIKGIASRRKAVYAMSESAASAVAIAMNKTLQINSPSKVTEKSGEGAGEGLILGMRNMEKDVSEEAARLAILSANVYDGAIVGLQNGFNASFNVKTKDYTGILKQMNSKLGRNNTVVIEKPGRSSQSAVNDLERALVRGMLY